MLPERNRERPGLMSHKTKEPPEGAALCSFVDRDRPGSEGDPHATEDHVDVFKGCGTSWRGRETGVDASARSNTRRVTIQAVHAVGQVDLKRSSVDVLHYAKTPHGVLVAAVGSA